jgi:hypothetical protein
MAVSLPVGGVSGERPQQSIQTSTVGVLTQVWAVGRPPDGSAGTAEVDALATTLAHCAWHGISWDEYLCGALRLSILINNATSLSHGSAGTSSNYFSFPAVTTTSFPAVTTSAKVQVSPWLVAAAAVVFAARSYLDVRDTSIPPGANVGLRSSVRGALITSFTAT